MNPSSEIRLRALERQMARGRPVDQVDAGGDGGGRQPSSSSWHRTRAAAVGWTLGKIGLGALTLAGLVLVIDRKVAVLEAKLEWITESMHAIEARMDRADNRTDKP